MHNETTTITAGGTVAAAPFFGITLNDIVLLATLIYILLQIFFLIRDKVFKKGS